VCIQGSSQWRPRHGGEDVAPVRKLEFGEPEEGAEKKRTAGERFKRDDYFRKLFFGSAEGKPALAAEVEELESTDGMEVELAAESCDAMRCSPVASAAVEGKAKAKVKKGAKTRPMARRDDPKRSAARAVPSVPRNRVRLLQQEKQAGYSPTRIDAKRPRSKTRSATPATRAKARTASVNLTPSVFSHKYKRGAQPRSSQGRGASKSAAEKQEDRLMEKLLDFMDE
jgi:hypothetical protein